MDGQDLRRDPSNIVLGSSRFGKLFIYYIESFNLSLGY